MRHWQQPEHMLWEGGNENAWTEKGWFCQKRLKKAVRIGVNTMKEYHQSFHVPHHSQKRVQKSWNWKCHPCPVQRRTQIRKSMNNTSTTSLKTSYYRKEATLLTRNNWREGRRVVELGILADTFSACVLWPLLHVHLSHSHTMPVTSSEHMDSYIEG